MYTETSTCELQEKDVIQDLVRLNLVMSRQALENDTVDRLRKTGRYSEEQLRMIGLVVPLVETHGHQYGTGLLYALLFSMDINGDGDIQTTLDALGDKVDEFKEGFSRPYVPEDDAEEEQPPTASKLH